MTMWYDRTIEFEGRQITLSFAEYEDALRRGYRCGCGKCRNCAVVADDDAIDAALDNIDKHQ